MSPGEEFADELLGDGMALEEPGEQPLAEEMHQQRGVRFRQGEKAIVRGEAAVGCEQVEVRMPEPPHVIPIVRESRFTIGFTPFAGVSSRSSRHLGLRTVALSRSRIPLAAD